MFKLIEFLKKRPSDNTIRLSRIIFGLIILLLLGLYFNKYTINLPQSLKNYETYVKYGFFIFGIIPLFMGISNICVAKRKYVRIIQLIFGIVLIIVGNNIEMIQIKSNQQTQTSTGSANFENLTQNTSQSKPIEVGFWIALLSIVPLLGGISGKCITSKCLKYGEVITKIRV